MKAPQIVNPNSGFPRAAEWNRLMAELYRLSHITAQDPLEVLNQSSGVLLRYVDKRILAVITGSAVSSSSSSSSGACAGTVYTWSQVQPQGDGTFLVIPGGSSGGPGQNPAYEFNGNCVQPNTVVWLYPGASGEYLFDQCCGANNAPVISSAVSSVSSEASSQASSPSSEASSRVSSQASSVSSQSSSPSSAASSQASSVSLPSLPSLSSSSSSSLSSSSVSSVSASSSLVSSSSTSSFCCPQPCYQITLAGITGACTGFNQTFQMTKISDCVWSQTIGAVTATLTQTEASSITLTVSSAAGTITYISNIWVCTGGLVVMSSCGTCAGCPTFVQVSPCTSLSSSVSSSVSSSAASLVSSSVSSSFCCSQTCYQFTLAGIGGVCLGYNQTWQMNKQTACVWSQTIGAVTSTLTQTSATNVTLTIASAAGTLTYVSNIWNCNGGTVVFSSCGTCSGCPSQIVITLCASSSSVASSQASSSASASSQASSVTSSASSAASSQASSQASSAASSQASSQASSAASSQASSSSVSSQASSAASSQASSQPSSGASSQPSSLASSSSSSNFCQVLTCVSFVTDVTCFDGVLKVYKKYLIGNFLVCDACPDTSSSAGG